MLVCVAGGKGGTGKTLVSTSLAFLLAERGPVQYLDCDVEGANGHLFLRPNVRQRKPVTVPLPLVDEDRCEHCGLCAEHCRFHAIASLPDTTVIYPELCHACGVCVDVCPNRALWEQQREVGYVEIGDAGKIAFVRGELNVGEPRSTAVIQAVKSYAVRYHTVVLDAPPGTSCPVVTTLRGCDLAIMVTEPTPFGLSDLTKAVESARSMHIPVAVVINRDGIGDSRVEDYCRSENIPVWARIPHDRAIAEACSRGELAVKTVAYLRTALDRVADFLEASA